MESSRGQNRESRVGKNRRKRKQRRKQERSGRKRKREKKQKKGKTVEVKRVVEEWEIWDKEEEVARSETEAKKMVPEKFHKWIKVFGKKQSERMPMRKVWDHAIDVKKGFVLRKGKVYLLLREEREEVREFIREQVRKRYI